MMVAARSVNVVITTVAKSSPDPGSARPIDPENHREVTNATPENGLQAYF